jgi:hypothetical protein
MKELNWTQNWYCICHYKLWPNIYTEILCLSTSEINAYSTYCTPPYMSRAGDYWSMLAKITRHWKDIYQRIFISYILSKNREKGYSFITFLRGYVYVEGYDILILGISNLYILSYPISFLEKLLGYFCLTKCIFFVKYRNKLWISSQLRIWIDNILKSPFPTLLLTWTLCKILTKNFLSLKKRVILWNFWR